MSRDDSYLLDIVLAARELKELARTVDRPSFEASRVHQLAFMKLLQDIGEAAARVSSGSRQRYSSVPWSAIIGLRNRLVHEYRGIDLDLVWRTVSEDIDPLLSVLERVVPPDTD